MSEADRWRQHLNNCYGLMVWYWFLPAGVYECFVRRDADLR